MKRKPSSDALWVKRQLDRPEWGMCALSDAPPNRPWSLDREPEQEKSHDPSGPRIRCVALRRVSTQGRHLDLLLWT